MPMTEEIFRKVGKCSLFIDTKEMTKRRHFYFHYKAQKDVEIRQNGMEEISSRQKDEVRGQMHFQGGIASPNRAPNTPTIYLALYGKPAIWYRIT